MRWMGVPLEGLLTAVSRSCSSSESEAAVYRYARAYNNAGYF
jgi:hypothetical protein